MATGSDGRFEESPSFHAFHKNSSAREIQILGKTERDTALSGAAVLALCRDADGYPMTASSGEEDDEDDLEQDVYFRVSIARGIDPALVLCFAAFVDEALEKNMRLQYESAYSSPIF
jgi:hypothetical protein